MWTSLLSWKDIYWAIHDIDFVSSKNPLDSTSSVNVSIDVKKLDDPHAGSGMNFPL